jgi:glycerol-3-phosphate dehydrogenase
MPHPGWIDVAGGKLTTYRLIGQQVVKRVIKYLGCNSRPCRTAREPLLEPEAVRGISSILPPEPTPELVAHFCRNEWAVHLDDVMFRRAGWHYYRDDRESVAAQVARWMAEVFGWDREREEAELARHRSTLS